MNRAINPFLQRFFIVLGNDCNLNCEYCIQHDYNSIKLPNKISLSLLKFIRNIFVYNNFFIIKEFI